MSSRQIRSDRKEKNAVMSFTVTDEPTFVDLTVSEVKEEVGAIVCNQICSTIFTYHISPFKGVKKEAWFVFGFYYAETRSKCEFMGVRIFITGAFIKLVV